MASKRSEDWGEDNQDRVWRYRVLMCAWRCGGEDEKSDRSSEVDGWLGRFAPRNATNTFATLVVLSPITNQSYCHNFSNDSQKIRNCIQIACGQYQENRFLYGEVVWREFGREDWWFVVFLFISLISHLSFLISSHLSSHLSSLISHLINLQILANEPRHLHVASIGSKSREPRIFPR